MRSRFFASIVLLFVLVWFSASFSGCARPPHAPTAAEPLLSEPLPQSECVPEFPDQKGWYGADAAFSVPLPIDEGRVSLWLFGDTFVARPDSSKGRAYPFVHNSIGISHCLRGGEWKLETYWRRTSSADELQPRAFFVPPADATWVREAQQASGASPYYWLFDGFIAHDTLFVGLLRVVESPPRGPFNLPFRLAGMDLARIENFRDAPKDWRIKISTLSNNILAFPGSAFVKSRSHLYAFAFFDRGDGLSPRMLSRLDLDSLAQWQPDLSGQFETWAKDGRWIEGFAPLDAMIVMDDDTTEMSVHFDPEKSTWLAVYTDPARDRTGGGRGYVRLRHSERLTGPWSKAQEVLSIPETTTNRRDESLFCYAGKSHPQFARSGELLITYVCNLIAPDSTDAVGFAETIAILERLTVDLEIYRPRAVSVELPDFQ